VAEAVRAETRGTKEVFSLQRRGAAGAAEEILPGAGGATGSGAGDGAARRPSPPVTATTETQAGHVIQAGGATRAPVASAFPREGGSGGEWVTIAAVSAWAKARGAGAAKGGRETARGVHIETVCDEGTASLCWERPSEAEPPTRRLRHRRRGCWV